MAPNAGKSSMEMARSSHKHVSDDKCLLTDDDETQLPCHESNCDVPEKLQPQKPSVSNKYSVNQFVDWLYKVVWNELAMDKEDEERLSWSERYVIRRRRLFFAGIHILAFVALYYCFSGQVKILTILWSILLGVMSSIGVTAGAHRLWSHRSFKATWQLRLILMLFQTIGVQYSLYNWARDHRLHHKHTDTDADPHNSNRGFFFSHIGWSVILPHPKVLQKIRTIDMSDVERDPIAMFQYKYYVYLAILFAYVLPTVIPFCLWNETLWISFLVACQLRHVITLHGTFLINSAAHMWGTKPYDKNINPTENMFVSVASFGDGWHNYHHVFPWDYRNSEFWDYKLNLSTLFVDMFAKIGWAYDLKTVPSDAVAKRARRTGDGSHKLHHSETHVWGWSDPQLSPMDKSDAEIRFPKTE